MLPAAPTSPQALPCRLRLSRMPAVSRMILAVCLGGFAAPSQLFAQDLLIPAAPDAPAAADPAEADREIAFAADRVEYSQNSETVTANGNVVLRREGQSVRADTVTWDQNSGQIVATGSVRMIDQDGNQLYTDRIELTDELKAGAMENLLLALREGGRLAAQKGERDENGNVVLSKAAYTGCSVIDSDGCPKNPSWKVTARQVIYNDAEKQVSFSGARLILFNTLAVPIPGLKLATDGHAVSGFSIPDIKVSPSNRFELSDAYYWKIAENRDLTTTAYVYSKVAPMVEGQYRALVDNGAYQITGYATSSSVNDSRYGGTGTGTESGNEQFRGYIFANGRFQLDPQWSITGQIRRSTDRTFLRRYDITRDDRLRSTINAERIDQDSYLSIAGWSTQTMRLGLNQGLIPVALPAIDYRHRFEDPIFGGKIEAQANSLAITRSDGQDTQRAFARAQWSLRRLTNWGQEVSLTGLVRGDVYHSDGDLLTSNELYRGREGWHSRGIATAAIDVKWPLVGAAFGGAQVLTPRIQIVATPQTPNLEIPNEDARAIELEDSNLFALNRFPGYDRIEDGVRFTYGLDWKFEAPRWRILTNIGQSVRLSNKPTLLPDGTGLTNKTSDIVGRAEVRYRDFVKVIHRFRLDKDNLAVRRNEFDAVVGNTGTYAEIGYTKLDRNISSTLEDLRDREELRFAGRFSFARYWSLFGAAVVNLTDTNEDPNTGSDGFQPIRTRLGAAYEDDCLQIALTWRRDYQETGDAKKGDTFQIRFALKNIGLR